MTLAEIIDLSRERLLKGNSLSVLLYYYANDLFDKISQLDTAGFTGEFEAIAVQSFSGEHVDKNDLRYIAKKLKKSDYKKYIDIYSLIGLGIQDELNREDMFEHSISEWFEDHSINHKYIIAKILKGSYEKKLSKYLESQVDNNTPSTILLQYIYLEQDTNIPLVLNKIMKTPNDLDIIDLLILEDLQNIQSIWYSKLNIDLFNDILWCASEIQSKHKVLNNNEDQYNSNFQSLLKAKNYKTEPQTQRGESSTQNQYGELDIAIFTENNLPISIFEAFVISSIETDYITKHLIKLSEHYDPNGLKNNYAVMYAKNKNFDDL